MMIMMNHQGNEINELNELEDDNDNENKIKDINKEENVRNVLDDENPFMVDINDNDEAQSRTTSNTNENEDKEKGNDASHINLDARDIESNILTTVNLELNKNTNRNASPIESSIVGINVDNVDIDDGASHGTHGTHDTHDTQSTHDIDNTPSFQSVQSGTTHIAQQSSSLTSLTSLTSLSSLTTPRDNKKTSKSSKSSKNKKNSKNSKNEKEVIQLIKNEEFEKAVLLYNKLKVSNELHDLKSKLNQLNLRLAQLAQLATQDTESDSDSSDSDDSDSDGSGNSNSNNNNNNNDKKAKKERKRAREEENEKILKEIVDIKNIRPGLKTQQKQFDKKLKDIEFQTLNYSKYSNMLQECEMNDACNVSDEFERLFKKKYYLYLTQSIVEPLEKSLNDKDNINKDNINININNSVLNDRIMDKVSKLILIQKECKYFMECYNNFDLDTSDVDIPNRKLNEFKNYLKILKYSNNLMINGVKNFEKIVENLNNITKLKENEINICHKIVNFMNGLLILYQYCNEIHNGLNLIENLIVNVMVNDEDDDENDGENESKENRMSTIVIECVNLYSNVESNFTILIDLREKVMKQLLKYFDKDKINSKCNNNQLFEEKWHKLSKKHKCFKGLPQVDKITTILMSI